MQSYFRSWTQLQRWVCIHSLFCSLIQSRTGLLLNSETLAKITKLTLPPFFCLFFLFLSIVEVTIKGQVNTIKISAPGITVWKQFRRSRRAVLNAYLLLFSSFTDTLSHSSLYVSRLFSPHDFLFLSCLASFTLCLIPPLTGGQCRLIQYPAW